MLEKKGLTDEELLFLMKRRREKNEGKDGDKYDAVDETEERRLDRARGERTFSSLEVKR